MEGKIFDCLLSFAHYFLHGIVSFKGLWKLRFIYLLILFIYQVNAI